MNVGAREEAWVREVAPLMPLPEIEERLAELLVDDPEGDDEQIRLTDLAADLQQEAEERRNGTPGAGAEQGNAQPILAPLSIVPAADFIASPEARPKALLGSAGETILPTGGFLLVAGEGGASKTTLTLDAVAHVCSGTTWLDQLEVARPLRVVVIENEGPRPKFRQKLEEKAVAWNGADWVGNCHVLEDPWGLVNLADPSFAAEIRAFCEAHAIDLLVGDPLGSLGVAGGGTPEETRMFMACLRRLGLGSDVAVWLLHHFSKTPSRSILQQLSGAWGGHPDTILGLELDGRQRTKLTWAKLRWATPIAEPWLLDWDVSTRGYTRVEPAQAVADEELHERITEFLADHPGAPTKTVQADVTGDNTRISRLLKEGADTGRYTLEKGLKNAHLWANGTETTARTPTETTETELEWR